MKKSLFLIAGLTISGTLLGQTWGGSITTSGNTYRTGNVGIGTTTPVTALNILTPGVNDGIRIQQTATTAAALGLFSNTGRNWALFSTGTGNFEGAGNFGVYDYNSGTYRMFINGTTGNVGFGTITPVTALNVATSAVNDGVRIQQTGTTAASLGLFNNTGRNWALFSTGTGNSEGAGNFGIYDYTSGGYRMFINGANGNMGLGTTTPATALNILTPGVNDGVRIQQTATTAASLGLFSNTGRNWALFSTGTGNFEGAGNFGIYDYSGGGYRMFINGTTGNVGIGTGSATPLHKLHVNNGAIMISGPTAGYGGPQLIFSDDMSTTPNGRWAIEYQLAAPNRPGMGGLNFWKPFPDAGGAGNYSLFLKDDGKIGMGVTDDNSDSKFCASALPNGYRLYVNGGILTTKVKVANYCSASWADYVFAADYSLKSLTEVEAFIKANKHLPNVPSGDQIEEEGLDLAEMAAVQMGKIEELTLYLIEMKKEIEGLKTDNAALKLAVQPKK